MIVTDEVTFERSNLMFVPRAGELVRHDGKNFVVRTVGYAYDATPYAVIVEAFS